MCLYVRDLTVAEGMRLQQMLRRANTNVITARRAEIVLASAQGMNVPDVARTFYCSEDHVRDVIHRFNVDGLDSLKPRYGGGRPPTFTPEQRSALVELALTPPQIAGFPWTSWSLSKLQEAAVRRKIVKTISLETIRQVLDEVGVSYQRTKTWKESNDPEFESKKTNQGPLRNAAHRRTRDLHRRVRPLGDSPSTGSQLAPTKQSRSGSSHLLASPRRPLSHGRLRRTR